MADLDVVAEATSAFDRTSAMRAQVDDKVAALDTQETHLTAMLDDLQRQYEAKAAELAQVRTDKANQQKAGDALSDAMDGFDEVLRAHGVTRPNSA